jgi:hypothetical protein
VPSDKLTARQRDRREHREACDLACRGAHHNDPSSCAGSSTGAG